MRVANSDWCASRMVVSVSSTCFCSSIQRENFSAPSSRRRSRVPYGSGALLSTAGSTGAGSGNGGSVRPDISGCPLTLTSPR
ncbi:hypothetical protein D9M69_130140 [compost metagenome]